MRALTIVWLIAAWALLACGRTPEPDDAPDATPQARIAMLGVWEGAIPALLSASAHEAVPIDILAVSQVVGSPTPEVDLGRYTVVLVLNLEPELVPALVQRLGEARNGGSTPTVVPLDQRDSQAGLAKAELLADDPQVAKYWSYGGARNFRGLLGYLAATYLGETRAVTEPELVPQYGLVHLEHDEIFTDVPAFRAYYERVPSYRPAAPWVAFLVHQRFILLEDTALIDAVVRELESRGLNVATVFASDEAEGQKLIRAIAPAAIITQRHTPMGRLADGTPLLPAELDVPYLKPVAMLGQTVEEWEKDVRGLAPRDLGLQVVMQELDGAIETLVVGGMEAQTGGYSLQQPIPERIGRFADRLVAQLALRTTPNADKKIAIVYYNKYLGRSDLGRGSPTGAFLNGPRSLVATLAAMAKAGYRVEGAPTNEDELLARMAAEGRNLGTWAQGDLARLVREHDPVKIPLATYEQWFRTKLSPANQRAVEAAFGPPPGELMVAEEAGTQYLVIPRIALGNIVLAPQPDRGPNQDETLVHDMSIPPPHQYLAFYWWLQEDFDADAVVHFGTHGTVELLPTKGSGLTKEDWPDIVIGTMPHVYPWILDNLAEATLAKRRSYATLVDHLVPPIVAVGLSREMKALHDDIDRFETLEPGLLREEYRATISKQAEALDLQRDIGPAAPGKPWADEEIDRLTDYLHAAHSEHTPVTLHVLGEVAEDALLLPYLVEIMGQAFLDHLDAAEPARLSPALRGNPGEREIALRKRATQVVQRAAFESKDDHDALGLPDTTVLAADLVADLARARTILANLRRTPEEVTNLLRAFEGRYIHPGPGNDPIRNPSALPTGRNLYALNPNELPTPPAWAAARKLVDQLLADMAKKNGRVPRKIGFDLNGFETMRNFGVDEGQILYTPGCRPIWDENRNVIDVELIPRAELGRPRVDVFVATSGSYRDNFSTRMELLDKCLRLAAQDPEPENYVREGTAEVLATLRAAGHAEAEAAHLAQARIFGQPPGQYGTQILHLIPRGGVWEDRKEITDVYRENMSFVYTEGVWGERREGLYDAAMAGTETIVRSWSSNMMSPLSNHHVYEYLGGLSMAVAASTGKEPTAWIADVRDPAGVRMRDFKEVLRMDYRTQLFNERWIRGMMDNDYAGAGHIAELTKNTFGWAVTRPGDVDKYIWDEIAAIYVRDKYDLGMEQWFDQNNPHALQEVAATLIEAARKGMWKADAAVLAELAKRYVESVAEHGPSAGITTGGNEAFERYLAAVAPAPGKPIAAAVQRQYDAKMKASNGERGTPRARPPRPATPPPEATPTKPAPAPASASAETEVQGPKLEEVPTDGPESPSPVWLALGGLVGLLAVGFGVRRIAERRARSKAA